VETIEEFREALKTQSVMIIKSKYGDGESVEEEEGVVIVKEASRSVQSRGRTCGL
jgi:hypothetical protein